MRSRYAKQLHELKDHLDQLAKVQGVKSALLLIADESNVSKDALDPLLSGFPKPLIGGIFPELIFHGQRIEEGYLIIPLAAELQTSLIDVSENNKDIGSPQQEWFSLKPQMKQNLFVFFDAFADQKNNFIHRLFNCFGSTVNYLGGGAGSLSFKSIDCIIHNTGLHCNAAVLGLFDGDMTMGVAHGWYPISDPMKITETSGDKIISIDWDPAFEVYQKTVEAHSGQKINEINFFDIAKSYPLGMVKLDSEMVIRDPYKAESNMLYILDEIPEGDYVSIMHGDTDSLLGGAAFAKKTSESNPIHENHTREFCVDCISRALFMQEDYEKELKTISGSNELDGILSIGEIANSGETFLEIYNKTIVLAQW